MVMVEETHVQEILQNLEDAPQSVRSLAEKTGLPAERVFRYVTALKRKEMVALDHMAGRPPVYAIIPQEEASGR